MSLKRKWEEVGEYMVSAAVGDMVSRAIATVVDKVERGADDGEVDRLDRLVTRVSSAADAADGVHIRSWWLRRWHWSLRDAACEGAAAVRSHRQRTRARARVAGGPWWRWSGSMVRLLFRSATNVVFRGGATATAAALRSEVARMEETAAGVGEFLKLLDIEIRRQEGSRDLRLALRGEERDAHQIRQPLQIPPLDFRACCRPIVAKEGEEEEDDDNGEDIEQDCADSTWVVVRVRSKIRPGLVGLRSRAAQLVAAMTNEDDEVANLRSSSPSFGHQSGGQLVAAAVINEDDVVAKQSRSENMEGRIWVVMRLALGARVIWFALQVGSQMFRRGRPARP